MTRTPDVGRTALVIHDDPGVRRLLGNGLMVFRPGFRVSTVMDLAGADDVLAALEPDVIVLQGEIAPPDTVDTWAAAHDLGRYRVIVVGGADTLVAAGATTTIDEPVRLPDVLNAVHELERAVRVSRELPAPHSEDSEPS